MGRKRIYATAAEKQAAFRLQHPDYLRILSEETIVKNRLRARQHAKQNNTIQRLRKWADINPERVKESKREYKIRAKQNAPFIAIDGEGITNRIHYYTLLSSSLGLSIENWKEGISTKGCFEFLFSHRGKGILVGFGLNYDVNMWLKDIPKPELKELWNTKRLIYEGWSIEWLKSKMFKLGYKGEQITVYDVFGFFQSSFINTLIDWNLLEQGSQDHKILSESKANRSAFTPSEKKEIKHYNLLECKLLVKLMEKLRQATINAECMPKSWHSPAAIAKTLCAKYNVSQHIQRSERLQIKWLRAYYGGRFQILKQGEFPKAYSHDISSAYPAAMRELPTSNGKWSKVQTYKPDLKWGLYLVEWKTPSKEYLNPFPFREKGEIYYPNKGKGWYYTPEIETALKYYSKYIRIIEGYVFKPDSDVKPFSFIDEIYRKRMEYKKQGNDAQKALKLGMNSLYGITAQSIGWRGQAPPYQNYFWAGFITSVCRAKVLDLAQRNKSSVIAFATDGVFSTSKLIDDIPGLGGWETDEIDDLFMLQSGVYAFGFENENAQPIYKKSRGFMAKSINYDDLRRVWREQGNLGSYQYKETRFIGLGSALPSLKEWCVWKECEREIDFTVSAQVQESPGGVFRILPEQPKIEMSEAYEPHLSWEEKDQKHGLTHDD